MSGCGITNPDNPMQKCQRPSHKEGLHTFGYGETLVVWSDPDPSVGRMKPVEQTGVLNGIRNRSRKETRTRHAR